MEKARSESKLARASAVLLFAMLSAFSLPSCKMGESGESSTVTLAPEMQLGLAMIAVDTLSAELGPAASTNVQLALAALQDALSGALDSYLTTGSMMGGSSIMGAINLAESAYAAYLDQQAGMSDFEKQANLRRLTSLRRVVMILWPEMFAPDPVPEPSPELDIEASPATPESTG